MTHGQWGTWAMGHMDKGISWLILQIEMRDLGGWGKWARGTWAMGYMGKEVSWLILMIEIGHLGGWGTWMMEHRSDGPHGQWTTWAMGHIGKEVSWLILKIEIRHLGGWGTWVMGQWATWSMLSCAGSCATSLILHGSLQKFYCI